MDEQRRAAWESAIAKSKGGEEVPPEEHYALLREGLFKGMNKVAAQDEARYVVRYWLAGLDCSPIPWRGKREADNWFHLREDWGKKRQAEKLRNMIAAGEHDPDYWDALNLIATRLHEERRRFPAALADWASRLHRGKLHRGKIDRPRKKQSNEGQPPYANDVRNFAYADVFGLLWYLGLTTKMECYSAIAAECGVTERTVIKAIKAASQQDGRLPAPWECWPLKT